MDPVERPRLGVHAVTAITALEELQQRVTQQARNGEGLVERGESFPVPPGPLVAPPEKGELEGADAATQRAVCCCEPLANLLCAQRGRGELLGDQACDAPAVVVLGGGLPQVAGQRYRPGACR